MIGWRFGNTLPVGRVCRGIRVGDRAVDVVFERPLGGLESPSGAALRLAEDLVAASLAMDATRVRVAGLAPSGRPVACVDGATESPSVSVSHVRGLLGAAVSSTGPVGIDIVDPADAGRALDVFFSPHELALVPDDLGLLRASLWAAKEAAFKAARLDVEFRPRQVTITSLAANGFAWVVRDRHAVVDGTGRLATVGRHVVAIAVPAAAADPDPAAAIGRGWHAEPVACS